MLKTFKAWLKGSRLEWIDDAPKLGEQIAPVYVTFLENESVLDQKARGQKMSEILGKIALSQDMNNIDAAIWQQETRQDGSLPGR